MTPGSQNWEHLNGFTLIRSCLLPLADSWNESQLTMNRNVTIVSLPFDMISIFENRHCQTTDSPKLEIVPIDTPATSNSTVCSHLTHSPLPREELINGNGMNLMCHHKEHCHAINLLQTRIGEMWLVTRFEFALEINTLVGGSGAVIEPVMRAWVSFTKIEQQQHGAKLKICSRKVDEPVCLHVLSPCLTAERASKSSNNTLLYNCFAFASITQLQLPINK